MSRYVREKILAGRFNTHASRDPARVLCAWCNRPVAGRAEHAFVCRDCGKMHVACPSCARDIAEQDSH